MNDLAEKRYTVQRHGLEVRVLHGLNAAIVAVLLVTGLAVGDVLGDGVVGWLGGHVGLNDAHQWLGLGLTAALGSLVLARPRRSVRLLRDMQHWRRTDWRWPLAFLRFYREPRGHRAPFHDGRFDPLQRLVLVGLVSGLALAGASGIYLYWMPPLGRIYIAWAVRVHVTSSWLLIACLVPHIVAGVGLPRTHRGLLRAMFGDGCVDRSLAEALWPGWVRQHDDDSGAGQR